MVLVIIAVCCVDVPKKSFDLTDLLRERNELGGVGRISIDS